MLKGTRFINTAGLRDLAPDVLDENGRIRILPAAFWAETTRDERGMFGTRHGYYSFPTVELVDYLRQLIGDSKAIEIGAGNGVLAEALGITATDNRMQEWPKYRGLYNVLGQAPVPYGPNIVDCNASRAVRIYKPDIVIGCWVTHKYDRRRHWAGGNEVGVDEEEVLAGCRTYVIVGNDTVHNGKKIWDRPHERHDLPFLYSRAINGTDFLAIWPGDR